MNQRDVLKRSDILGECVAFCHEKDLRSLMSVDKSWQKATSKEKVRRIDLFELIFCNEEGGDLIRWRRKNDTFIKSDEKYFEHVYANW